MATAPPEYRDMGTDVQEGLCAAGEPSDMTIVCYETSSSPARLFRVHKKVVIPQSETLQLRMKINGEDDKLHESHIAGIPPQVVEAMVRYFYYHTLDLSSQPLPVDRLIFSLQLSMASAMYGVKPLFELTHGFDFEARKDAEVYIAALRRTCDMASVSSVEEAFNSVIRIIVQVSIVRHLPAFMIRESFRSLLEERPDIVSQMLPMILLPEDLPTALQEATAESTTE